MNDNTARLIREIRAYEKWPVNAWHCAHGAIAFPRRRLKATRILAVQDGVIEECCRDTQTTHVFLKIQPDPSDQVQPPYAVTKTEDGLFLERATDPTSEP